MIDEINIDLENGILKVTINRVEKKNALTRAMYLSLVEAFNRLSAEAAARVMLLTGSGDSFTSGNDVMDFMQHPPTGNDSPVSQFLAAMQAAEKPIVAAVNGCAVGVGTTMLLHCDFVYAARSSWLQMPFINLALVPENGSSKILPEMVGHRKAAELFMLGERFSPELAAELGIINSVVDDQDLMDCALKTAKALALKPPEALRITKRLMKTEGRTVVEAIQQEGEIFHERLRSPEALEAMSAFLEKRQPDFTQFD